jgi:membrane-associated protease RseP (regulator of RpoE activity)
VSDDTPTGETEPAPTPPEEPVEPVAAPEPAAAPEPVASSADATAAEPAPATADATAAEPVTAEPEPVTAEPESVPATTSPPNPPAERRGGILVPVWAAILVAVLLIGGIGFAVGYVTADDDGTDAANASNSQLAPNRGGPFSGNGGGYNVPNGNENGNGNGQTTAQVAFLGVELESAANSGGARISSVRDGSPAADAGLKAGDVVTKIGDTAVTDDDDLIRAVRAQKPGDEVTVTYTRDGNSAQVKVTLGDRSEATRSSVSP